MNDEIKPFRDAFEQYKDGMGYYPMGYATKWAKGMLYFAINRDDVVDWFENNATYLASKQTKALYKAAKMYSIAELQSPNAALLWRLTN